jgi:hypothetical protein
VGGDVERSRFPDPIIAFRTRDPGGKRSTHRLIPRAILGQRTPTRSNIVR